MNNVLIMRLGHFFHTCLFINSTVVMEHYFFKKSVLFYNCFTNSLIYIRLINVNSQYVASLSYSNAFSCKPKNIIKYN